MRTLKTFSLIKVTAWFFLIATVIGCNGPKPVKIIVERTTIAGTIQIENNGNVLLSENLQSGGSEFEIEIPKPDFYELKVFPNGADPLPATYVYLDGEDVRINPHHGGFPTATSSSAIQEDAARYYDQLTGGRKALFAAYNAAKDELESKLNWATGSELHVLTTNLSATQEKYSAAEPEITRGFIAENTGSLFSAFLLEKTNELELARNPSLYRELFEKLTDDVKRSYYGKKADLRTADNLKGAVGTTLPSISGKTVDGRSFDPLQIKGKLTLVAFWRSLNKDSASEMVGLKELYEKNHAAGFEILALSFDKTPERWKTFMETNNLPWINVCDFEGASSPNLKNFNNDRVPFYFLIGPDLKILARDVRPSELPIYLKEHLTGNTTAAAR